METSPVLLLTNDLWAHIFSLAAKEVIDAVKEAIDKLNATEEGPTELSYSEEYIQLHSLLICKKFNNVFFEHPELSASLFLGASSSVPETFMSLVAWMQARQQCGGGAACHLRLTHVGYPVWQQAPAQSEKSYAARLT